MEKRRKIALVGNPNSGKTSLFNRLTGLNQKVGNYPGVTVDKRSSAVKLPNDEICELIDLPGTYSLSSTNDDEQVVQRILLNPESQSFPDLIVLVADATNLMRNLFLASQIIDLGIPTILALNMVDILKGEGKTIDFHELGEEFGVPVLGISARKGHGVDELKQLMTKKPEVPQKSFIDPAKYGGKTLEEFASIFKGLTPYMRYKALNNFETTVAEADKEKVRALIEKNGYKLIQSEILEINDRYEKINGLTQKVVREVEESKQLKATEKIDKYVTHPFWGFLIFFATFFIIFQAVFTFASFPMDAINDGIMAFGGWIGSTLPEGMLNDFLVDGIIAGLAGVLIFVPQIMILFGLIAILEDSGYLSRVSFMTDGLLRRFGMNGKSIVPLVGGFACAIPAIMAARGIENRKERLITIFITPLMSCSARLPVYVFLVSFIAPDDYLWGVISVQGLFMMGLYLLGIIASLVIAILIHWFTKKQKTSSFILELPNYKIPSGKNALTSMINKGKIFVMQAGKVILIASVILWVLSYFGPSGKMNEIEEKYATEEMQQTFSEEELNKKISQEKLEYSFLGYMGRAIEPAIEPLGYDWKVGIAIVASFAAREVFVGTMATIYSVEEDMDDKKGLKAIKFSYATAFSLLIFYVFALQCMSTIAIVRQETGKWSTTILQFVVFTGMAYVFSLITYQVLA